MYWNASIWSYVKTEMAAKPASGPQPAHWTYLTNHAHVLVCLARDPDARIRDIARRVGITERAVQAIVTDLESAGAITRTRSGRRNHYEIRGDAPLRHPIEASSDVASLLSIVLGERDARVSSPFARSRSKSKVEAK